MEVLFASFCQDLLMYLLFAACAHELCETFMASHNRVYITEQRAS